MPRRYRSLRPELIRRLELADAWPTWRDIGILRDADMGKIRNDAYVAMKRGEIVNERYIAHFVALLCSSESTHGIDQCREVVEAFLVQGISLRGRQHADAALLDELCGTPQERPKPMRVDGDFLLKGFPEGMAASFARPEPFAACCQASTDELDRQAARWMYVTHGRDIEENPRLAADAAAAVAETRMDISCQEYARRMSAWRSRCPWSVMLARGKSKPNGVAILLPVSDHVCESILAGELMASDVTPEQLQFPTRSFVAEVCSERPIDLGGEARDSTFSLWSVMMVQLAALAHLDSNDRNDDIRILCFDASPPLRERLLAHGFTDSQQRMQRTGEPLFQVGLSWNRDSDARVLTMLSGIAASLPSNLGAGQA